MNNVINKWPHTPDETGGGEPPMESRIARLEADVDNINTNIADIKTDIRELRNQGKWMISVIGGIIIAGAAMSAWVVDQTDNKMSGLENRLGSRLDRVDTRIDKLNDKMDKKFDTINTKIDKRFDQVISLLSDKKE